jgi:hypothetical protein
MHRRTNSVAGLALIALLIGAAAVGCAGKDGAGTGTGQQATFSPAGQTDQVQAQATDTLPPASDGTAPDATGAPGTSDAPGAAAPQIDAQLNAIDQSLGNLNGSLSGADAGPSAGE